jgi:hypothetical protein
VSANGNFNGSGLEWTFQERICPDTLTPLPLGARSIKVTEGLWLFYSFENVIFLIFHGAFMVGLIENWPLPKTLEFSAAVAAMKCRGLGGRAMIPGRHEVEEFLREKIGK